MTPEDRTLDGAAVDEVARDGAAAATPSGDAAPADSPPAGDAPDENVYHKALDAYMNGDLTGVVKLVDGVLEQKPVAGLKSRLERLRRRATDRLSKETVDAPAEPAAAEVASPTATEPTATTEPAPEPAAVEPVAPEPTPVAAPEPAPVSVDAPLADAITAEPPVEPKIEPAPAPVEAVAAPEPVAATETAAPVKADTPVPADRPAAKRSSGTGPSARPSGSSASVSSGNTTQMSTVPSVNPPTQNRPPSGAPAGAPPGAGRVVSKPVPTPGGAPPAGARPRMNASGSQPALTPTGPSPTSALKAELDRVAGELDKLRKVVSGVEEHIVKVAEAYGKLAKDGKRKDQAYDQLYEELRQYKDNFLKTAQKPLFLDVVLLFDGITRTLAGFSDLPDEKVTRQMVVDALSHTRDEILELLYRRDIEKISDAPKKLDVAIQKPVTRIDTDNADEDRDIVQVVREGFRWSGVVLRPQEVVVKRSIKERESQ